MAVGVAFCDPKFLEPPCSRLYVCMQIQEYNIAPSSACCNKASLMHSLITNAR
jgi:hypothetical protein